MRERRLETWKYGTLALRECFDADSSMNGEGYVEAVDENGETICEVFGRDIDDIDEDTIDGIMRG